MFELLVTASPVLTSVERDALRAVGSHSVAICRSVRRVQSGNVSRDSSDAVRFQSGSILGDGIYAEKDFFITDCVASLMLLVAGLQLHNFTSQATVNFA
jgi:hypothetical protein